MGKNVSKKTLDPHDRLCILVYGKARYEKFLRRAEEIEAMMRENRISPKEADDLHKENLRRLKERR